MKKFLSLFLFFFGLATNAFAANIVLVADAWPPYNNAADDEQKGYVVDIAEMIFARNGHTVEYRLMPWTDATEETRKGTYDGLICADSVEAAGFVFPHEEIGISQLVFYVRKDNPWRFTNTRSLGQVSMGVAEGYNYNNWLHAYIQANIDVPGRVQVEAGDFPLVANINKLLDGQVATVVATSTAMEFTAAKLGVSGQIQPAGSAGQDIKLYLAFTPGKKTSQRYAEMIDAGLREMRANGELAKILKSYGMSDWK